MEPLFLTLNEVLEIHRDQIERYGGTLGVREHAILQSAFASSPRFGGRFEFFHPHRSLDAIRQRSDHKRCDASAEGATCPRDDKFACPHPRKEAGAHACRDSRDCRSGLGILGTTDGRLEEAAIPQDDEKIPSILTWPERSPRCRAPRSRMGNRGWACHGRRATDARFLRTVPHVHTWTDSLPPVLIELILPMTVDSIVLELPKNHRNKKQ